MFLPSENRLVLYHPKSKEFLGRSDLSDFSEIITTIPRSTYVKLQNLDIGDHFTSVECKINNTK